MVLSSLETESHWGTKLTLASLLNAALGMTPALLDWTDRQIRETGQLPIAPFGRDPTLGSDVISVRARLLELVSAPD